MKRLLLILLSALSLTAFAQQKKVAVLNPICRDNSVNTFYQQIVRGAMESAVTATDEYVAFDRTAFDKVIEEHNFERSGAVEDSQIRQMGVYAGVDFVLITEVSAYDGYMSVLVKILNIETGESSRGLSELMEQTPPIVQSSCENLAKKLFGIVDVASGKRKGTLQLPEGRYEGEIQNGKPHGKGIMFYSGDILYTFEGDFIKGKRHGYGVLIWRNGERYEGDWLGDMRMGQGTQFFKNGNKYIGHFSNNAITGEGTMYYHNGNYIEGTFLNGYANGICTFYYKNNRPIYSVSKIYEKDKKGNRVGEGSEIKVYVCKDIGPWSMGKRHGTFTEYGTWAGFSRSVNYINGERQ